MMINESVTKQITKEELERKHFLGCYKSKDEIINLLLDRENDIKQLKNVINEVREYVKECSSREISLDILEILDKVKSV